MEINLGNTKGVKRKVENLNRIVIPKDFFRELKLNNNDQVEIFLVEDGLYIRKFQQK